MIFLGLFFLFLYSFVRGITDGIVWWFPNPRQHRWFKFYHGLRIVEAIGLIVATIFLWSVKVDCLNFYLILGALFAMWELFELGYKLSRKEQVKGHENFLGIFAIDNIQFVYILHIARFACAITLLTLWRVV